MRKIGGVLIAIVFLVSAVSATYSGVRPAIYKLNFQPGYVGNFTFHFVFEKALESKVYVSGNLSEYVTLDKDHLKGSGDVVATLRLPQKIETPGTHRIRIGVKQLPTDDEGGGVSLIADVGGIIKVFVPYPGKYLEGHLSVDNINVGQKTNANIVLKNLGKKNVSAKCKLNILHEDSVLNSFDFGEHFVQVSKTTKIKKEIDTSQLKSGDYVARAVCDYGGEKALIMEQTLRVGKLFVNISGYTKSIKKEGIQKFKINLTSYWNSDLKGVHVRGSSSNGLINFETPSSELKAWQTKEFVGFVDPSKVKGDSFELTLQAFYNNKTTTKKVVVSLEEEGGKWSFWWWILLVILIAIVIFIIIKRRKDRDEQKKK